MRWVAEAELGRSIADDCAGGAVGACADERKGVVGGAGESASGEREGREAGHDLGELHLGGVFVCGLSLSCGVLLALLIVRRSSESFCWLW